MTKILVIGDIMLDRYLHGECTRQSPEAPVPVFNFKSKVDRLGGAANVANNLKAMGCDVTLCGVIGLDEPGITVENMLNDAGIKHELSYAKKTIVKQRVIAARQMIRIDYDEPLPSVRPDVSKYDIVVFSDYAKGTVDPTLIKDCKYSIVDPKGDDFEKYRGCNVITPNEKEFRAVVGDGHLPGLAYKMSRDLEIDNVVVTRGYAGIIYAMHSGNCGTLPAEECHAVDVTGAGDTVVAAIAANCHKPLRYRLAKANFLASKAVSELGTVAVGDSKEVVFDENRVS